MNAALGIYAAVNLACCCGIFLCTILEEKWKDLKCYMCCFRRGRRKRKMYAQVPPVPFDASAFISEKIELASSISVQGD